MYRDLLLQAAERGIRYREGLDEQRVAPTPETIARLTELGGPLPDAPTDAVDVLKLLDEIGSPATVTMAGGRYFGFVMAVRCRCRWRRTGWPGRGTKMLPLPSCPRRRSMEEIALGWLVEMLGLPPGTGAGFVTGATMANFTGLAAARHALLEQAGWDVEEDGLFGAPPMTVVVGEEVHVSLRKALGLLGLGRRRVVAVPVDGQGRMRADALPKLDGPASSASRQAT